MTSNTKRIIEVSQITRSRDFIDALNEHDVNWAYMDDPDVRWIISAELYRKGLGYFRVYVADKCNVTREYGDALFGHQDTIRHIIQRSRSNVQFLPEAIDLTEFIC